MFVMTDQESILNLNWNIQGRDGSWILLVHLTMTNIIVWMFFVPRMNQWICVRYFLLLYLKLALRLLSFDSCIY